MSNPDKTTTARLLRELNAKRGFNYPDVGYSYFADVKGNGIHNPQIYTIINPNRWSHLFGFERENRAGTLPEYPRRYREGVLRCIPKFIAKRLPRWIP